MAENRGFEAARIVVTIEVDPDAMGLNDDYGSDDAAEVVAQMLGDEFGPAVLPLEFDDDGNVTAQLVVTNEFGEHEIEIAAGGHL